MTVLPKFFRVVRNRCFHAASFTGLGQRAAFRSKMQNSMPQTAVTIEQSQFLSKVDHLTVPFGDTSARVGYVDVGPRDGPVLVAVHGAPGSVLDFSELYGPLADKGIRVVSVEFPGYGNTTVVKESAFNGSTEARATLVHNFLSTLGIERVTTVLGHSAGIATAFHLAANCDYFKSVIYLNGIGFIPQRSVWPYTLVTVGAWLMENPWLEPVLRNILLLGYWWKGYDLNAVKVGMKEGLITAARIGFDTVRTNATRIKEKRLPGLFAFTQNDRFVEIERPMEVIRHFETPENSITWFDAGEKITKGPSVDDVSIPFPWVMIFERGGHFVHRSHNSLTTKRISNFVDRVQKSS